jgi:fructuronate reductase
MRYVGGVDEQGNAIDVSDPQLAVIQAAVKGSAEGKAGSGRCSALRPSLARSLPREAVFVDAVMKHQTLLQKGAKATVAQYVSQR